MFDYLKQLYKDRKAFKAYKAEVRKADFERMTDHYAATKDCPHTVRIAKNLNHHEEEVRCMQCGLIKIIPRVRT